MNQEQALSIARAFLQIIGTFLTTYGFMTSTMWGQVTGGILMIVPIIWALVVHTETNAVAVVAAIAEKPGSPVKGVVTEATAEGRKLANEIPGAVAPAGTAQATEIAKAA